MEAESADAVTVPPVIKEGTDADEGSCLLYEFVVCTVIIGVVCVFGLVGNFTSFFVLCKHKTETATIFLLQCMAMFDSLLLLVALFVYVLPGIYPYTGRLKVRHSKHCFIIIKLPVLVLVCCNFRLINENVTFHKWEN